MSQWDFGHGREPAEHQEPQYPQQPPYPYPAAQEQEAENPYPAEQEEAEYPYCGQDPQHAYRQEPQYQYPQEWPQAQFPPVQQPLYPDDQQAGWPDADGYPDDGEAYDPPTAYPITYERDTFEGRAALPGPPPPDVTTPYSPWPDASDPADRFSAASSASRWSPPPAAADRFRTETAGGPWRPPPPAAGLGSAGLGSADRKQAFYPSRQPPHPDDPADPGFARSGYPPPLAGAEQARSRSGRHRPRGGQSWRPGAGPWPPDDEGDWGDEPPDRGRWLIPVGLAVVGAAVGAAIVMFALGHGRAPSGPVTPTTGAGASSGPAGATGPTGAAAVGGAGTTPLTLATARSVLSAYTTANNSANARRSSVALATVETGGSYAIDAGLYTVQAAEGATPYAAFAPVSATYYIPQAEPADATRWFVVQVANAFSADPKKVTSTEYLLFTQAASGGRWQNAVEPYLLAGADAPQVAVSGAGFATAVSATATSLAVPPGQLAGRTAAAIDGTGSGVTVPDPGALADRSDQTFWRGKLPTATVTDAHAAATGPAGQTFALLTTNGGALVFYTDAADLQITPPAGQVVQLTVPGFYSSAQALSRAGLSYLDQFAAADPPARSGAPRVVAQYSGLTGKN